ncbi:hypothetical protein B7P43_G07735 [Cryptotermes secundus]|uniref:Uncharacterized protein n=1 Tax=Cryptotermes secundus TaxID=105785 RepID=A0A2J7QXL9_9NEOP|nr:hypothetical protein B7P43_G07735 [Cryptotermes secundus]
MGQLTIIINNDLMIIHDFGVEVVVMFVMVQFQVGTQHNGTYSGPWSGVPAFRLRIQNELTRLKM